MSEAAKLLADGWDTSDLPTHLVENVPLTCEVTTYTKAGPSVELVQLERDGVPLTMKDKVRGWTAGTREGWRER